MCVCFELQEAHENTGNPPKTRVRRGCKVSKVTCALSGLRGLVCSRRLAPRKGLRVGDAALRPERMWHVLCSVIHNGALFSSILAQSGGPVSRPVFAAPFDWQCFWNCSLGHWGLALFMGAARLRSSHPRSCAGLSAKVGKCWEGGFSGGSRDPPPAPSPRPV